LISVTDWWKYAERYEKILLTGPALTRWHAQAPPNVVLADEQDWNPKASAVGKIAVRRMEQQQMTENIWSLKPIYSRLSAAEEKIVQ
jgi:hypothetical protein